MELAKLKCDPETNNHNLNQDFHLAPSTSYDFTTLYQSRYYPQMQQHTNEYNPAPELKRYPYDPLQHSVLTHIPQQHHQFQSTTIAFTHPTPNICSTTIPNPIHREEIPQHKEKKIDKSGGKTNYNSDDDDFDDDQSDDEYLDDTFMGSRYENDDTGWVLLPDACADMQTIDHSYNFQFTPKFGVGTLLNPEIVRGEMGHLEAFQLFITEDMVAQLVEWTNKRANAFFTDHPELKGKLLGQRWHDLAVKDMWTFIFMSLQMSVCRLPSVIDYWRESATRSGPPIFCSKVMGRNRYYQILRFIKFSCPDQMTQNNPLSKVDIFVKHLQKACTSVLDPGQNIVVDRSYLPYQCKIGKRHNTRTKWNRIRFSVCTSAAKFLRGYTWNFSINIPSELEQTKNIHFSPSEIMIVNLIKDLLNQGRLVVLDKDHNSINLANFLLENKTFLIGTIKEKYGVPSILNLPLKVNGVAFARKGRLLIAKHQNKMDSAHILSTQHIANDFLYQPKPYNGKKQKKPKHPYPRMIKEINQFMAALDLTDSTLRSFEITRDSYAWFKKLGLHLIARMAYNAKVVYENSSTSRRSGQYCDFIDSLVIAGLTKYNSGAQEIITNFPTRKKAAEEKKAAVAIEDSTSPTGRKRRKKSNVPTPAPDLPPHLERELTDQNKEEELGPETTESPKKRKRRYVKRVEVMDTGDSKHNLQVIPSTNREKYPRKWCNICAKTATTKANTRTRYACYGCPKPVGLCSKKCFEEYHDELTESEEKDTGTEVEEERDNETELETDKDLHNEGELENGMKCNLKTELESTFGNILS